MLVVIQLNSVLYVCSGVLVIRCHMHTQLSSQSWAEKISQMSPENNRGYFYWVYLQQRKFIMFHWRFLSSVGHLTTLVKHAARISTGSQWGCRLDYFEPQATLRGKLKSKLWCLCYGLIKYSSGDGPSVTVQSRLGEPCCPLQDSCDHKLWTASRTCTITFSIFPSTREKI